MVACRGILSSVAVFVACLLYFLHPACAVQEDQAGELEWKIDGIGEIQLTLSSVSLFLEGCLVPSSC
jgi:hypothetical protein